MDNTSREALYEPICHRSENLPLKIYHTTGVYLHWHKEYEFILVKQGSVSCILNGEPIELTENSALLLQSGDLHSIQNDTNAKVIAIVASPTLWEDEIFHATLREPVRFQSVFTATDPFERSVIEMLWQIVALYEDKDFGYGFAIKAKFSELFSLLIRNRSFTCSQKSTSKLPDEIKSLIHYIHEHYTEKISLRTLSSVSFFSQTHIINFFKRYTNFTPAEYILRYRLEIAKEKLRNTNESNVSIALCCGFHSETYFIRAFKKLYGMTPYTYRKQQRSAAK